MVVLGKPGQHFLPFVIMAPSSARLLEAFASVTPATSLDFFFYIKQKLLSQKSFLNAEM